MQIEPSSIVVFLIGGFSGGLLTYLKEKGKNRALLEDIKKIEGEKQDVSHKYAQKLEKLRRDHTIEIEQRKYQYEAKQTQYINFFAKLDEYTRDANQKIKGDVTSKFSSFMMNYFSAEMNNDKEKAALTVNEFMEFNQNIMNDINAGYISLKQETNAIRLVCTTETERLINTMESNIHELTELSFSYLSSLCSPQGFDDPDSFDSDLSALQEKAKAVEKSKNLLKENMKKELNEI